MTKHLLAASAALLTLSACGKSQDAANNNAAANTTAVATPAEMPPAITAQKTYRCKDQSLVYVDFQGDTRAQLRDGSKTAAVVPLSAEAAGKPLKGAGFSVSGQGQQITFERPGKPSQSCKA